jgi:hypothetical protein
LFLVAGGIFAHKVSFLHHTFVDLPDVVREAIFGLVVQLLGGCISL